jgi:nitrous oxide reductase accessory protein NosL
MILRTALLLALILTVFGSLVDRVLAQDDIKEHRSCTVCGMDRKAYGYSRVLILYQDGSQTGVCSLHCAVAELAAHKEREAKSIQVADRDTRLLIDAEKAIWVIGGKKRGVMTQIPKWAFETEAAARSFIAANGGSISSWAKTRASALEEVNHSSK